MFKKTLLAILVILVVLIGGLCVAVALQPDTYRIERSATMAAPPDTVFAQIGDLRAWDNWTPWKDLDPNPKTSISDPSTGKGATFAWSGNDQIGEGTLTILESVPDKRLEVEQAFVKPMEGKARMVFVLLPEGEGTKITWSLDGSNDFLGKAMCMVMDMDAMLGPNFEKGLANLKTVVEASRAEHALPPEGNSAASESNHGAADDPPAAAE